MIFHAKYCIITVLKKYIPATFLKPIVYAYTFIKKILQFKSMDVKPLNKLIIQTWNY